MLRPVSIPLLVLLSLGIACSERQERALPAPATELDASLPPVRIFVARQVVTMDPVRPRATAVAVEQGRIRAVGDLESLLAELADESPLVDDRFAGKVLLPGFIDNHLHPSMAALLLPMEFVTPYDWNLPDRQVKGVLGQEAYRARLAELAAGWDEPERILFAWGYHPLFHGPLTRADLDAISTSLPIVAWHRSFHEIIANSRAVELMGVTPEEVADHPHVDLENGHFYETGLEVAFGALGPRLLAPERFGAGLVQVRDAIHRGGITTVADMATGIFDLKLEWPLLQAVLEQVDVPFRTLLIPDARRLSGALGLAGALELIESLPERNGHRLRFVRQVKLFSDGAFYSQLMQLGPPGYLDGHRGEWLMEAAELEVAAKVFWNAGYQIHVHVNGDEGVRVTLDVLERLLTETPRTDHRFALHHFGYSTDDQSKRAAELGAVVSANPFYLYALGDAYAKQGLGPERAAHMVRLGSLLRNGVHVSLHSDFTMAPAEPLRLAWVAANRETAGGQVMAPEERLDVGQALRAITLDAAHAIQMEDEIGSIEVGKRADFTVLERDPTAIPVGQLADIPIWGTVFEGQPYPIADAP